MSGILSPDATVRIPDPSEAGAVYGKGYYGTLETEGLRLDRVEAVYLAESGRIVVENGRGQPVEWPALFRRATRAEPEFGIRFLVYRDLRQRGYVVRAAPPPIAFAVLPRGGVLHKTPSRYWVVPVSERSPFDLAEVEDWLGRARGAKKNLLVAVVDEESDLTYYRVRRSAPTGTFPEPESAEAVPAFLADDRIVVFDPRGTELLGRRGAFGSRIGLRLELSLIEGAFLAATGAIVVRNARTHRRVPLPRLESRAARLDPRFAERLATYRELRRRRLVVKTGFKYGAHFRAYARPPEHAHARYLVRAIPASFRAPWPEIAGAIRLAQGVRKEFLFASVAPNRSVEFLTFERIRP